MTTATHAILRVTYDTDQLGNALLWRVDTSSGRNLLAVQGRYAGALHFEPKDEVYVEVTGSGRIATFASSRILAAHLITRPHAGNGRFSPPSPFSDETAVVELADWSKPELMDDPPTESRYCLQRTTRPLPVIQASGSWELSFVLTVALVFDDNGRKRKQIRVFSFDPESEVGDGTDPA